MMKFLCINFTFSKNIEHALRVHFLFYHASGIFFLQFNTKAHDIKMKVRAPCTKGEKRRLEIRLLFAGYL